jgi:thioredoxin reductase (NADPH)
LNPLRDRSSQPEYDAVVVGGGPAGMTAALYVARFHLSVLLADMGASRAALIPRTHNQPYWPDGISGKDLLKRMRRQMDQYAIDFLPSEISALKRPRDRFELVAGGVALCARSVILATGVVNHRPAMSEPDHERAVRRGLLRYCPICDGYEATDRDIAVIGRGVKLYREARFLRSYSANISVISPSGSLDLSRPQRDALQDMGIALIDDPVADYELRDTRIVLRSASCERAFDTAYAALGSTVHSGLAMDVGAKVNENGCVLVDAHQRTSVPGLYAAGDVVPGVDQIGHAIGQATVAATTLRNDLNERSPLMR